MTNFIIYNLTYLYLFIKIESRPVGLIVLVFYPELEVHYFLFTPMHMVNVI